ncbi:uncharacterized protein LOC115737202 isoform X2 [Rhodamnia argentea]|uniref:Uncharacterized protein LOC115737202 isoform X2 n=1 Tax=Rhodamnia argentea TaxID=178133 RepID=A0ABM3HD26_9MYRT|nr:uncharacterized protein LOC115737202 isoform X2 [Rhodamnia argentea]
MRPMETIRDLIEEAKVRTLWWALVIFAVSYFLSHTSKSMWMNIPIAILFVSAMRIVFNEVDVQWKVRSVHPRSHLSILKERQLSINDSRLTTPPPPQKWKRKIDSPIVEAAITEFINKILRDFVIDLWYADITPDRDFPEHIRAIIMDALGEISGRVKAINLVDLLTRRNQAVIGTDVMGTLSSEERDERLKFHLMASKELHPALVSPESEYKVLQRLVGGVLTLVLRPREAQCPVVRSIARELVTCVVIQPVMDFASPAYINEVIELLVLAFKEDGTKVFGFTQATNVADHHDFSGTAKAKDGEAKYPPSNSKIDSMVGTGDESFGSSTVQEESKQPRAADWARVLEAATQRRTEVLMPENLENLWSKGRNYKKREAKKVKAAVQESVGSGSVHSIPTVDRKRGSSIAGAGDSTRSEEKAIVELLPPSIFDSPLDPENDSSSKEKQPLYGRGNREETIEDAANIGANDRRSRLKRSNSTSALKVEPETKKAFTGDSESAYIAEFYSPDFGSHSFDYKVKSSSDMVFRSEGPRLPKLKCRVLGAYFEKLGSKSFAVYSIAVTDAESKTWFVKRRYSNFERLHRHLKEIPNYTLHLPPKRIFSSSTEDAFVHQRCIQLDKYLQDLLSIANVAEQHEVWDFLSASSKNYSFGKSSSVMRSLAVNVDDAVDDIVRQFKGVSNGLMRKVVGPTPSSSEASASISATHLSWNADEIDRYVSRQNTAETSTSISDNEDGDRDGNHGSDEVGSSGHANGWHSDTELNSKNFPPRVVKRSEGSRNSVSEKKHGLMLHSDWNGQAGSSLTSFQVAPDQLVDPVGMPPEWSPPNVCVPMLNLVDKIFQLKRRGWLRRQVFWISKQILQLVMEDAIDDWLLRQIHWLRSEETVAQGIGWVQDVLWPDGTFFLKFGKSKIEEDVMQPSERLFQTMNQFGGSRISKQGSSSFELQLEAARRASDVKKMLFEGAPTTLVSLIGHKQYRRCAKDMYYFLQSSICVKQLAYGILELLLVSVFPELRDVVVDIHQKMRVEQPA